MRAPLLYQQLSGHVLEEIRSGRLRAGDRVPSEKELAERFRVSRITSRKALETLHQAKVIVRVRGKGSFVAADPPPPGQAPHPPEAVSGTVRSPTPLVGLILPDLNDAYGLRLLDAVEERCAERNCHLLLKRTYGRRDVEREAIASFVRRGADGLVVFPVHGEYYNADLVRLVLDGYPLVLVDRHLDGIAASAVQTDNVAAARALTGYLLDRGHRRVAFVSPPPEHTSSIEERIQGYRAAQVDRGLRVNPADCLTELQSTLPGASDAESLERDRASLRAFLGRSTAVTAFVACEYSLALLLRQVLAADPDPGLGGRPIVCFDSPEDRFGEPKFTHVRQDERAMGRAAVDALVDQIGGAPPQARLVVPFALVEGRSTATPALTEAGSG